MKSDVFFVSASPTARLEKKMLDVVLKAALDASFERNKGCRYVNHTIDADTSVSFQKALVTVIYDEPAGNPSPKFGK